MATNALVRVGGVELPEPSTYNAQTSTLVDSARNAQGKMIGSVIRDDVAKVELSWRYLPVEDWAKIGRLFKIGSGGSFINSVTFFDQTEGNYVTREMYCSDRTSGMWRRDPETGAGMGWTDCKVSFVEV